MAPAAEEIQRGAPEAAGSARDADSAAGAQHVFRAESRLVMVHVTVTDSRGRYIDDLGPAHFQVVEDGQPRQAVAFESLQSGVSCALLLDTTASMHLALPALKSAALQFIADLRPVDSVAVYNFSDSVTLLQPFTLDKDAAQKSVMTAFAAGQTALYDALARVSRDLSVRGGKKVIVLFSDGEDNASTLASRRVMQRMRAVGLPVYTVAQGQALQSQSLMKELADLSTGTGGLPYAVAQGSEMAPVFERIAQDLAHGYLLAFTPEPSSRTGWRRIDVVVKSDRQLKVRAREGYALE
jgi:VWFA-related protein